LKEIKGFIVGVVVTVLLALSYNGTFADSIIERIDVGLNSVNLMLNGVMQAENDQGFRLDNGETVPFSIVYKGTTYLPVKKLSELVGMKVEWNGDTRTVILTSEECISVETENLSNEEESKESNESDSVTNEVAETEKQYKLDSAKNIEEYLNNTYDTLNTSIGKTKFEFEVIKNTSSYSDYDYWIQTDYDLGFFLEVQTSIEHSSDVKNKVKEELRNYQYEIAQDLIKKIPDKKIYCGYYKSWYRYPSLKVDLISRRYYTWKNYDDTNYLSEVEAYYQNIPSTFRWDSNIDDEL